MLSDKDVIIRIKNGEIDYYSFIVNKYTASIYRYIEVKIKKKEDVEDLVQNVFISFYKAIDRFDENKPVKPYLYQIVTNELKMFYRKYKNIVSLNENIYVEEVDKEMFDEQYFKLLNEREKQMLLMIADGYSYEEIAKKFKKPINTVKSIVRRARNKLKVENKRLKI